MRSLLFMPQRWDSAARLRAEQIERGLDLTFSNVFVPYFQSQLRRLKPTSVLEVGGGTGHLCKSLCTLSANYVVVEPSAGMFDVARAVLSSHPARLLKETLDSFVTRGERFDAVISHMCVQTVEDLDGFCRGVALSLHPSATYLISLPHPAFYNQYKSFFEPERFRYIEECSREVSFAVTLDPSREISGVPYYHRPIGRYVSALAQAGLYVSGFDEIFPKPETQALYGQPWKDPRYLVLAGGLFP